MDPLLLTAIVPALVPATPPGRKGGAGKREEKVLWSRFYGGADPSNLRRRRDRIKRPKVLWRLPEVYGVPAETDESAYCCGKALRKIDLDSGREIWRRETKARFGWTSPGVAPGVILAGSGKVVVAFDQETGAPDRNKVYRTHFNPFGSPTPVRAAAPATSC